MAQSSARVLAWVSLGLLAALAAIVVALLVISNGLLAVVGAGVGAALVIVGATFWWAFTTRRPWKRRLNVVAGLAIAVAATALLAFFSLRFAAVVVTVGLLAIAFSETARRALASAGAAPPMPDFQRRPQRPWLLVNLRSGGGKADRLGLVVAARQRGVEVHVLQPGDDLEELARNAVALGCDAVGVAGGDGSLGAIAAVAKETGVPFFCIPTGTRNHFAADIGLDRSRPLEALEALAGSGRRIDLGWVNDRPFLNNVSIGAYADMVHEATYRDSKFETAQSVLSPLLRLERDPPEVMFRMEDGTPCSDALVLLVANNPYQQGSFGSGSRGNLDAGMLQVSVLRARTGVELANVLARIATSRSGERSSWAQWTTPAFRVDAPSGDLQVGIDGEAAVLSTPLEFRTLPQALTVLVPRVGRRRRWTEYVAPVGFETTRSLLVLALRGRLP